MKSLLLLVVLVSVAHADKFPATGPCDDVDACEKACKAGKKDSCYWGGALIIQKGVKEEDEAHAMTLFDKACAKGHADACWQSANLVWYKESREKGDGTKARAAFQKACNKNHARACMRLADIVAADEGNAKSQKLAATLRTKGLKLLEGKCNAKMARACGWVGELYESGLDGITMNHDKAAAFRDKKCVIETGSKCKAPVPPSKPPALRQPPPPQAAPSKADAQ